MAYSQDAAGSLTKKGDTYLHYDGVDGRIVKVGASADPSDALAVGYVTNALGQRVLKRDARLSGQDHPAITQQTVYAEDGIGSTVLGQYGNRRSGDSAAPASEMDSTEVIWLPTATGPMPVAAQINGRLYAIDADHLNTPRRLTNAQGQVVWQWLIAGFGEANPTTGATGYAQDGAASGRSYGEQVRFDLRYPGQVWDEETGLSYNLHRYYDAGTGRYVQADPIGLEGGWNRFGYVVGNPLSFIDAAGLHAEIPEPNNVPGGPWIPNDGNRPGNFSGPKPDGGGGRAQCQWVPADGDGGPPGSKGYWKVNEPGTKGWTRFDQMGLPITPEQAHPGRPRGGGGTVAGGFPGGGSKKPFNPLSIPYN